MGFSAREHHSANRQYLYRRIAWQILSLAEGNLFERAGRRAALLARDANQQITTPRAVIAVPAGNGATDAKQAASPADERVPPLGTGLGGIGDPRS